MKKTIASALVSTATLSLAVLALGASVALAAPAISIKDAAGDDKGPGYYAYPTNAIFAPGSFDMTGLAVEEVGDDVVFSIEMANPIKNGWGGPNGISVQLFHIYVDNNPGDGKGFSEGIPGANLFFAQPWKKAILCEGGWGTEVEDAIKAKVDASMRDSIFVAHKAKATGNVLNITVPKAWIGTPSPKWGVQVAVMGQEGSKDVMDGVKVRRVLPKATEWQFGGAADASVFHPNALDIFLPEGQDQKAVLGSFSVDDETWATIPLVYGK